MAARYCGQVFPVWFQLVVRILFLLAAGLPEYFRRITAETCNLTTVPLHIEVWHCRISTCGNGKHVCPEEEGGFSLLSFLMVFNFTILTHSKAKATPTEVGR